MDIQRGAIAMYSEDTGNSYWSERVRSQEVIKSVGCQCSSGEDYIAYVNSLIHTLGKGMNPIILPPAMGK